MGSFQTGLQSDVLERPRLFAVDLVRYIIPSPHRIPRTGRTQTKMMSILQMGPRRGYCGRDPAETARIAG